MAHLTYPFTITPNTLASASQVMGNFDAIKATINGGIDGTNLADKAVTAAKLADKAVNTSALADAAVSEAKLAAGAVTTAKLADGSVTNAKLAANAVTTEKIAAGAVATDRLANAAVTEGKLASGAVTSTKLGAAAVTSDKVALRAVQMAHLGEMWVGQVRDNGSLNYGPDGFTATRTAPGRYTISYSLPDGNYVAFIQPRVSSGMRIPYEVSATKSALTVEITDTAGVFQDATFNFLLVRVPDIIG